IDSLGRHQSWASSNWLTQCRIRSWPAANRRRASATKAAATFRLVTTGSLISGLPHATDRRPIQELTFTTGFDQRAAFQSQQSARLPQARLRFQNPGGLQFVVGFAHIKDRAVPQVAANRFDDQDTIEVVQVHRLARQPSLL